MTGFSPHQGAAGRGAGLGLWTILVLGALAFLVVLIGVVGDASDRAPSEARLQTPLTLPCVSYAPFRRPGHTPFDPHLQLSAEQIRQDLLLLKPHTPCVRLYGTRHGQDQVPAIAAELGMTVVVGAWIDRDPVNSRLELDAAVALANAYPQVVRMLMVGNEVLLRQERTPQDLAALLQETRSRTRTPVAYADVWEFWRRHAAVLRPSVDVMAIHVLPYWEDHPIALDSAVDHVVSIVRSLEVEFAPTPVWLAETGWPAQGRQRGPAVPGAREQAEFVRALAQRMDREALDYNFIEGFDQPWKRRLEGAMGGAWGILQSDGELRPALRSTQAPDPAARAMLWASAAGVLWAGLIALAGARGARPQELSPTDRPVLPLALVVLSGAWAGLLIGHHLQTGSVWPRDTGEWLVHGVYSGAVIGFCALSLASQSLGLSRVQAWGGLVVLALACVQALALVADGRYRPLPASLWAAAAVAQGFAGLVRPGGGFGQQPDGELQGVPPEPGSLERGTQVLAIVLGLCALALVASEGWINTQALALSAAWIAWVILTLWPAVHGFRQGRITAANKAATAAAADRSAS